MNIDFTKVILAEELEIARISDIKQSITSRRYSEETRGIDLSGVHFNTERDSQALVTSVALSAYMDSSYTCKWKTPDGFVELNSAMLISIAKAIRKHVQSCFDREDELLSLVDSGQYTEDMLDVGWP